MASMLSSMFEPLSSRDLQRLVHTCEVSKCGQYPVVLIQGEAGKCASHAARVIRLMQHGIRESAEAAGLDEGEALYNAAISALNAAVKGGVRLFPRHFTQGFLAELPTAVKQPPRGGVSSCTEYRPTSFAAE